MSGVVTTMERCWSQAAETDRHTHTRSKSGVGPLFGLSPARQPGFPSAA